MPGTSDRSGPYELLADEGGDPGADRVGFAVCQRADGARVEDLSHHRGDLDQASFIGRQPVQPGREERRDRRRDRDVGQVGRRRPSAVLQHQATLIDEEPGHLLGVEGVSFGRLRDPRADRIVEGVVRQQVRHERPALLGAQRLDEDRGGVQLPAGPCRVIVQEFGACHAREQDRRVARQVRDVFDELQELRLSPLQVVDREDQRPLGGELFQQHPNGPECLFGSRCSHRNRSLARPAPRSCRRLCPTPRATRACAARPRGCRSRSDPRSRAAPRPAGRT